MASEHHRHVVVKPSDAVNPRDDCALAERDQHDDSTSGVVVEQLEDVHAALKSRKIT